VILSFLSRYCWRWRIDFVSSSSRTRGGVDDDDDDDAVFSATLAAEKRRERKRRRAYGFASLFPSKETVKKVWFYDMHVV
jgi:hypothetical protein